MSLAMSDAPGIQIKSITAEELAEFIGEELADADENDDSALLPLGGYVFWPEDENDFQIVLDAHIDILELARRILQKFRQ